MCIGTAAPKLLFRSLSLSFVAAAFSGVSKNIKLHSVYSPRASGISIFLPSLIEFVRKQRKVCVCVYISCALMDELNRPVGQRD